MSRCYFYVGQPVGWVDPENGVCAGTGVIVGIQADEHTGDVTYDSVVSIRGNDGRYVDVLATEVYSV